MFYSSRLPGRGYANSEIINRPWRRFPVYLFAQFLGGFCAAGVVYGNYISAIDAYEGFNVRTVSWALMKLDVG